MTTAGRVVLAVGAIVLVSGLYHAGARIYASMKSPEPGSREWQIRQFRKDWRACDQFARKREDARKLLAWTPKPPFVNPPGTEAWAREYGERMRQESDKLQADFRNLNTALDAMAARWKADELDCLRDLYWPDVQIESLKKEIRLRARADELVP